MKKISILIFVMVLILSMASCLAGCFEAESTLTFATVETWPTAYMDDSGSGLYVASQGDSVDLTGLTVKLTYSDGTYVIIDSSDELFANITTTDADGNALEPFTYVFDISQSANGYPYSNYVYLHYGEYELGSYGVVVYPPYIGTYRALMSSQLTNTTGVICARLTSQQFSLSLDGIDSEYESFSYTTLQNNSKYELSLSNVDLTLIYDTATNVLTDGDDFIFKLVDDSMHTVTLQLPEYTCYLAVDNGTAIDLDYLVDFGIITDAMQYTVTCGGASYSWSTAVTADIVLVLS